MGYDKKKDVIEIHTLSKANENRPYLSRYNEATRPDYKFLQPAMRKRARMSLINVLNSEQSISCIVQSAI